jgi:hypothetical protein
LSPPSPSPPHKSSSHIGAIIGGTLGGLALLGILVGILLWRCRRAQQDRDMAIKQPHSPEAPRINPFDLRFADVPSMPPRTTEFNSFSNGHPPSVTQGSTSPSQTDGGTMGTSGGPYSSTSSGPYGSAQTSGVPSMGEVASGVLYPGVMNSHGVGDGEEDGPPEYPATEVSHNRRSGKTR